MKDIGETERSMESTRQPKLTRAEVEQYVQEDAVSKYVMAPRLKRLAQDCLDYMTALEQVLQHIELDCLDCRCPIPASIARAVLPASEEATK